MVPWAQRCYTCFSSVACSVVYVNLFSLAGDIQLQLGTLTLLRGLCMQVTTMPCIRVESVRAF